MNTQFITFIKLILQVIIEKKLPPTFAARTLFILSSMVWIGLSTINPNSLLIENYKLKYNYTSYKCELANDSVINQTSFYNNLVLFLSIITLELLNRDIKSKLIYNFIIDINKENLVNESYNKFLSSNSKLLVVITDEITYYYNQRNKDGWTKSNKQISINNNYKINPNKQIISEEMNNPITWCPLNNQRMVGSKWGNVKQLITNNDSIFIQNYLLKEFKKINLKEQAKQVLDISLELTQTEKMIAEFWAGIGGSVTPPGFFNMFLYGYFVSNSKSNSKTNFIQVEYFYKLNCGLFQASITAWGIKYDILQCRPIQSIRINYPKIPINYYFGQTTTDLWTPYQESRAITPPFPDYISGHSTFSSVAAYILTSLLGSDIPSLNIKLSSSELLMLAPIFKDNKIESMDISKIIIPINSSRIVPNTPCKPIELKFKTWSDMASSAGISRIYGGIHYPSSNTLGLTTGKLIYKSLFV